MENPHPNPVLLKDYSKVSEGGRCPHQEGGCKGIFEMRASPDGSRKYLACNVNEDHWRWLNLNELGLAGK